MEKYGFVYLWYDRKHKRFYIGCHWGTEDDGYICSSNWMRDSYKRRPNDFKRKIIKKIYTNRKDLLEEEYRYLYLIKDEELGKKYYNLSNKHFGHWITDDYSSLSIKEKISIKTKEAMNDSIIREKYLNGLKIRDNKSSNIEVRQKRRESMIGKNVGKDNSKALKMAHDAVRGTKLSDERKQKIKDTTIFKTINNTKVSCIHCGTESNPGNIGRYHNDKCKRRIV